LRRNSSCQELVNDDLKASLQEDLEDIKSWEERKDEDANQAPYIKL